MAISTEQQLGFPSRIDFYAGSKDFPHSRQLGFPRGVMSPQNGHIRCGANVSWWGAEPAKSFKNAKIDPTKRRTREKSE